MTQNETLVQTLCFALLLFPYFLAKPLVMLSQCLAYGGGVKSERDSKIRLDIVCAAASTSYWCEPVSEGFAGTVFQGNGSDAMFLSEILLFIFYCR